MIARLGSGWQTITADLALILFLVTAQASFSQPATESVAPASSAAAPEPVPHAVEGSGTAVFRPGPDL
ncbi:MAG: hypothetical protein MK010_10550, partial [Erythrobacter sp.]|nr:hypothetical protein [Erythrobacter sp.]